jgi:catechol 2,3-dioxygenase-like lactoylglutathione lyase family enzyme
MANYEIPSLAFHHIGVRVQDFEKEKEFFINGLGMKPFTSWGNSERQIQLLEMGNGGMVELFSGGSDDAAVGERFIHFAMQVDDVEIAFRKAIEAGASCVRPVSTVSLDSHPVRLTVQCGFIRTPGGAELEFFRVLKAEKE